MSTIAILSSGQTGASSLININNNYSELNTGKAEISGQVFTGAISATNFSGTSSGTNTGDQTNITGNAATATFATTAGTASTVTTNANLTGTVASVGNATSITNASIDLTTKVTGILPVAQGGTGSTTRNFVDLTSTETIGGGKTFSSILTGTAGVTITGATVINVSGTAQTQIGNGSTGALFVGSGNNTQQISMAETGTKTVTLGSTGTTSSMLIQAGTNPIIQSTQQPATGVVQRISNTIDTVDTFITNTTPQGAITASIGDTAYDNTSGIQYYKGSGTSTLTGWEHIPSEQYFRLIATGTAITTTSTNYFGTTSGIGLVANGYYEIEATLYFLKTTNGTVTFTLLNGAAPTSMNVHVECTPNSGIIASGQNSNLVADFYNSTSATQTFTSGGNFTGAVNHYARFKIFLRNGTGTSLNFQISTAAGSVTPGIGSYWKARKLPDVSVGNLI